MLDARGSFTFPCIKFFIVLYFTPDSRATRCHWPRSRSSFPFTTSVRVCSIPPNNRPYLRLMQAHLKASPVGSVYRMGKTRRKKVPSILRKYIARNVELRADIQFPGTPNRVNAIREKSHASEREKLSRSHIQNILAGKTSASLEQLEKLGRALDLMPYQLLLANLDAENPQVAKGAAEGEDQVYAIREAVKQGVSEALATTTPPKGQKRR